MTLFESLQPVRATFNIIIILHALTSILVFLYCFTVYYFFFQQARVPLYTDLPADFIQPVTSLSSNIARLVIFCVAPADYSYTISGDLCCLSLPVESLPSIILHYFRRLLLFISPCGISPADYLTLFQETCYLYLSLWNLSRRLSYIISGDLCSLSLLVESPASIILHFVRPGMGQWRV